MNVFLNAQYIWFLVFFFISSVAFSSDINYIKSDSYILINGEIKKGDFEKFVNATLEGGVRVKYVYLASNGGNVDEALRIGRFIRAIGYSTKAPFAMPYPPKYDLKKLRPLCPKDIPVTKQECTCMSSCVFLYLAGVEREGDFLGVHRAFLNHKDLRQLSLENSKRAGEVISAGVNKYLLEMKSPLSLIDKVNANSSGEIEILSNEYVEKYLSGVSPDYQEWLIAKCGDRDEYSNLISTSPEQYKKYEQIIDERYKCYWENMRIEIEKKFYEIIQKALKSIDHKLIPHRSLLADILEIEKFKFVDLIGKTNDEAMDLMSLIGVGQEYSLELKNVSAVFNDSVMVGFDGNGKVFNVELHFNNYYSDGRDYEGYFIDGMTRSSSRHEFIKRYGVPYKSGCYPSGNCFDIFELNKADVEVLFDEDKKLINLSVNRSGYWRALQ